MDLSEALKVRKQRASALVGSPVSVTSEAQPASSQNIILESMSRENGEFALMDGVALLGGCFSKGPLKMPLSWVSSWFPRTQTGRGSTIVKGVPSSGWFAGKPKPKPFWGPPSTLTFAQIGHWSPEMGVCFWFPSLHVADFSKLSGRETKGKQPKLGLTHRPVLKLTVRIPFSWTLGPCSADRFKLVPESFRQEVAQNLLMDLDPCLVFKRKPQGKQPDEMEVFPKRSCQVSNGGRLLDFGCEKSTVFGGV